MIVVIVYYVDGFLRDPTAKTVVQLESRGHLERWPMLPRSLLLVMCGLPACGKTTAAQYLARRLPTKCDLPHTDPFLGA
jgi:hypothetical protein